MSSRMRDAGESIEYLTHQGSINEGERKEKTISLASTSLHKRFNLPFNIVTVCLNIHEGKDTALSSTSYRVAVI